MKFDILPLTLLAVLCASPGALAGPVIAATSPTTTDDSITPRDLTALRKVIQARQYNPRAPRMPSWKRQADGGAACPA